MNKGTAIVGFFLAFLAGMALMWGIDRRSGVTIGSEDSSASAEFDHSTAPVPVTDKDPMWGKADAPVTTFSIGIDKAAHTLFYGFGDAVTAQSLSQAMKAVGVESAAQLDVNYSYPRFLLYERATPEGAPKATSSLVPGVKFVSREYVEDPSPRDFFYLVRRKPTS